ncbi:MAG TPA: DUF4230 domain-containing protein [Polyangiaceae bacterium]|nr:DUF4230 domain-containing protein [Polyangiaceae bacterium]
MLVLAALLLVIGLGLLAVRSCEARSRALLPPLSSASTVLTPTPNVLASVRDLARLETTSFHMERVLDLSEKQSRLFGLIESEDALLLVAVAEISAGVDLSELTAADVVVVEGVARRCSVHLPPPRIFHAALDNAKTYVHTRRTGVLARRQESLETRARQEAERALLEAAREVGILPRAAENARRVVEGLLRSLGCQAVEVKLRGP